MRVIGKLIIRNLLDKKLRLFLLILSLVIPSALFFVANGAATTTKAISMEVKRKYVGSADIIVTPSTGSPPFLSTALAAQYDEHFEYTIGSVEASGMYRPKRTEAVRIRLRGIEFAEMQRLHQMELAAEQNLLPFAGRKLIISKQAADKYGLNLGDSIALEINGLHERFLIAGIARSQGLFLDDGEALFMAVPRGVLAAMYGAGQAVNQAFIKLRNPAEKQQMIASLSEVYKGYTVKEAVSAAELERDAHERTDPYKLIVVVLLFMGIFVIYSASRAVAVERLPVVGTLRSVGATKWLTGLILMGESLAVGVVGGLLGCVSGVGLLHLLLLIALPSNLKNVKVSVDYTWLQLAAAFGVALCTSIISALIPMLQTVRLPIKQVIFGPAEQLPAKRRAGLVIGLLFALFALVAPRMRTGGAALAIDLLSVVMAVAAAVFLAPTLTAWTAEILAYAYTRLFGNIGALATKNLKENSSIMNNIALLTISIASFLVINTLSQSVAIEMKDLFRNNALFDVSAWVRNADQNVKRLIAITPGVQSVFETPVALGVAIKGTGSAFETIHGADKSGFLDYWGIRILDTQSPATVMEELDAGRNILVSNLMRDKLQLKKGDLITLRMGQHEVDYKVIGFIQSYNSGGRYGIIASRFFKIDVGGSYWSLMALKTRGDGAAITRALKTELADRETHIMTVDAQERASYEQYESLFTMLKAFSILTLITSLFGAINNLVINFIQRKRSLAVLRSIGMSKTQIVGMMLLESFTGGLIGSLSGCLGGLLMISVLPFFMIAIEQVTPVHLASGVLAACLVAGVLVSLMGSVSPVLRSWRLNIIEAIKYE